MKDLKKHKEIFRLQDTEIQLWVPDQKAMQFAYENDRTKEVFPYWAKIWPSAYILIAFINEHLDLIKDKKVLELAAGLGLPSLFTSRFASSVLCSDYDETAVQFIQMNIELNKITNMFCKQINWTELPSELDFEILLLSDINYNPEDFDTLLKLIHRFLKSGKTILLTTPQRLAGKAFISKLLPWCLLNEEKWHDEIAINVLVLKK